MSLKAANFKGFRANFITPLEPHCPLNGVKIGENAVFGEEKAQKLGSNGLCAVCKIMCYMA